MTTTTDRAPFLATDRQRGFITRLVTERAVPAETAALYARIVDAEDFKKSQATELIDQLLATPLRRTTSTATATVHTLIAPAFFAIPTELLSPAAREEAAVTHQSLLYGVVGSGREGRNYLDTVKGAPGAWNRTRQTPRTQVHREVVALLAAPGGQRAAMDRFGAHFTVCGKCASPLSDDISTATGYGPTCRKVLGL